MTDRPELQRIRKRDPRGDGDRDPRDERQYPPDVKPQVVDPPPGTPRPNGGAYHLSPVCEEDHHDHPAGDHIHG